MTYNDIITYIKINFPELEIYQSYLGKNVGNGITIDWEHHIEKAVYATYTDKNDVHFKFISIGDFKNIEHKKLALLHELGHHTSVQNGNILEDEMNAWDSCFEWFNKLDIILTKELKLEALKWFMTYVKIYGSSPRVKRWIQSKGFNNQEKPRFIKKIFNKPLWGLETWKHKY